jgi:hypothetical protein
MAFETVAMTNESTIKYLSCLSKISCAMICQAMRDYTKKTHYYLSNRDWESSRSWLYDDNHKSHISFHECCSYINNYLVAIGSIGEDAEAITVAGIRKKIDQRTDDINDFIEKVSSINFSGA